MANDKAFSIIKGGTTDGAVLRGRDVEFELQGVDVDPRIKSLLYRLAEINHINMKSIAELGSMFDQMVDTMTQFAQVAHNMKERTDLMMRSQADVDPDVTTDTRN